MSDAAERVKAEVVELVPDDAAQAEAEGWEEIVISFAGEEWTIPASAEDADVEVLANLERASKDDSIAFLLDALEGLFGRRQFNRLKAKVRSEHNGRFVAKDLQPLVEVVGKAYGFSGG